MLRSLARVEGPTLYLSAAASQLPSSVADLRHSVSICPCDDYRQRFPVECLPLPMRELRSIRSPSQLAPVHPFAARVWLHASGESKVDWCARFRSATSNWRCGYEFVRAAG